ncbi:MAG: PKD domain-containing protein, partial [Mycobacterium leprae]
MLKRSLSLLALVLMMIPAVAFAGTLATRVMTTGGSITVNNVGSQSSVNGTVSNVYPSDAIVPITMTPAPGYVLSKVTVDGVAKPLAPVSVKMDVNHTVSVAFARQLVSVSATAATNDGTVSPSGTSSIYAGTSVAYTFSPYTGKRVEEITGLPAGANLDHVLPYAGIVKATFTVPTQPVTIVAKFVVLSANAGPPQTVLISNGTGSATLAGTTSAPATYAWTQVDGPATATIDAADTLTPTVTFPAAGDYRLKLTATSGTLSAVAYTTVAATTSITAAARAQCADCHANADVAPTVYPAWSASVHAQDPASICASCHVGANTGAHPAPSIGCVDCHSDIPAQPAHTGTGDCKSCHTTNNDAHTAKFASVVHSGGTAFLKAQYVSTASLAFSCADCHGEPVNQAILAQFTQSAHGNPASEAWLHYDWRTSNRSSCARCHTGTGFVAKLGKENDISSAFQSGDVLKAGEALGCSACHANAGTGELRVAAQQFTINMKNGAVACYDVAGASTLCARCHSGRETGESIKADTAAPNSTGERVFVDSHYQPVTGIVYNKGGYEYAGQNYDLGSHKFLLGATGQGPCVTCHMPGKDHTFVAAACGACHGVTALAVDALARKASYDTALNNLKLALEAKGIYYGPVHPFFFTSAYAAGTPNKHFTKWDGVYGAAAWKDTMGAAFNYNMLWSDKAAYAH